jgi:hypothetical protein
MTRQYGPMDKPIEQIVDAYVRLQNWKALEDLRTHRRRLLSDLKGRTDSVYDVSGAIRQLEDELAVIEAGLQKLSGILPSD